jgi:hypothetical protein
MVNSAPLIHFEPSYLVNTIYFSYLYDHFKENTKVNLSSHVTGPPFHDFSFADLFPQNEPS